MKIIKFVENVVVWLFLLSLCIGNVNAAPVNPSLCGSPNTWACGSGGCASNQVRRCVCTYCEDSSESPQCLSWSCSCQNDSSCVSCSPSCGSNNCGDNGCGGSCGSCASGVCNSGTCCVNVAPVAPVIVSPANGAQVRLGVATTLDWLDTTSFGNACTTPLNSYQVCISSNQISCDIANWVNTNLVTQRSWTPTAVDTYVTWQPRANNGQSSTAAAARSVCVEGFDSANTAYVSAWSACSASATRTRTCREDCGTDDCAAFTASGNTLSEQCTGLVRGTIFDASSLSSCPAFDPATGYSTGLLPGVGGPSRTFGFTDQSAVAPHPFAPLSSPTTDSNGNYSISVYSGATYLYNFDAFSDYYITTSGPKLTCTSVSAVVPASAPSCTTQPCSVLNNMSFGFNRIFGGWWSASGASVHAETGIRSSIPPAPANQSLIIENPLEGNRLGFLSYGVPRPVDIFGYNPTAQVSTQGWEKESSYNGQYYDWYFYDSRFNLFSSTIWNGTDPIVYNDSGQGYQILRVDNAVNSFTYSPAAGEKLIILVNGDVNVTSDINVPATSFLAIIAKGTITFSSVLTGAEGWYVASNISVPCHDTGAPGCDKDDVQFVGNGSFVSWGDISLTRDQGIINNTQAAEKFTYRQDLYYNAPKPMKLYTKVFKPFIP